MLNLARRAAAQQIQGAGLSLSDFDRVLDSMFGGFPVWAGSTVSQQTALAVDTLWACVSAIADDIATLPTLPYYKTFDGKGRPDGQEVAIDHYLYPLLMHQVNPELSSWRFFQLMQSWLLLWGNACAELIINGRGQVMEMWPWRWDRTHVTRKYEGGPLQYQYRLRSGNLSAPVPRERMFHLRGLGIDGILGLDPIQTHKQNIGLSLALTEHGARYFGQGAKMGGIIQGPAGMKYSDKAWERIDKSIREKHEGLTNAHRIMILEDGFTWKDSTADSMVNAEWIAGQKMTAQGIARMMKVPLYRVGLTDAPPAAAVEQLSLQYVLYTLASWCANWQNQIHCDLLSNRESQNVFTCFDFFSLLRGDHDATQKYVSAFVDRGILNADEVRGRFLGLNKQPDGIGQEYYKAVNMAPVGEEGVNSLTAPANVGQVQKVKKKQSPTDDGAPPPKTNGHAALHAMGVTDNLIDALVDFMAEHQRLN